MRQAIKIHVLGPTDNKDRRLVAKCEAGRRVFPWRDDLSRENNYHLAAATMISALDWGPVDLWSAGWLSGDVAVFVDTRMAAATVAYPSI